MFKIDKVISGGQTGADRGGLDAAIVLQIPHGGWCPKGRRAEDGTIPLVYELQETASSSYADRTFLNVEDSEGTVVITKPKLDGGSLLTVQHAQALGIPWLHLRACDSNEENVKKFVMWLNAKNPRVLNVAGSRESSYPGIQRIARDIIIAAVSSGCPLLNTSKP